MWRSIKLFLMGIVKGVYFWVSLVCLLYAIYDINIKQFLPEEYQKELYMPGQWGFVLFTIIILFAGANAYHKLRMVRIHELYKYSPEVNKDRVFRIFYELYKEGEFLKEANTERRQKWDEDVLKEIKQNCREAFGHIYLQNTGRRNYKFSPLEDCNYEKALHNLKDFINRDFNQFVKT